MEIASGDSFHRLLKNNGIIGHSIHFNFHLGFDIGNRIRAGSVHLGYATQGITVLNPKLSLTSHISAFEQQFTKIGRRLHLPVMGTDRMNPGIQRILHAPIGFKAQSCCNIRRFDQRNRVIYRQGAHRSHSLRSIDESQALLGHQFDGGDSGPLHGNGSGKNLPLILRLSQAQHGKHHVRKRRQIAAGPQRALLRNNRRHAAVQHLHQGLHQLQPGTGKTFG